ncbi:hypothetical protein D3C85_1690090 [compost metagenome]
MLPVHRDGVDMVGRPSEPSCTVGNVDVAPVILDLHTADLKGFAEAGLRDRIHRDIVSELAPETGAVGRQKRDG